MKTLPVNIENTNNAFKGLWKFGEATITDADYMSITRERTAYYHSFANEDESKIRRKIAEMGKPVTYANGDYDVAVLDTNVVVSKALSFTKEEFTKYKHYYGKNLPKRFKQIEQELKALGLDRYLNRGKLYKIKCFFHRFI